MLASQLKKKWANEAKAKRRAQAKLPPFQPKRIFRQNAILNRQELKYLDTAISTSIDSTTEVITGSCNLVTQGDGATNRDGNVIEVKSIEIQGRLYFNPGAAATAATGVYIWLVWDKQPNGAVPSVFAGNAAYLVGSEAADYLPVPANQYRYKTLVKLQYDMVASAGVTTAYNTVYANVHFYKKFKEPIQIRFGASTGAITDVMSNNLAIIAGSSATDDLVNFLGNARIRFTG